MKRFLLKAFFFLGTVTLAFLAMEWIPDYDQVGHRPWEGLSAQNNQLFNAPFYPNQEIKMEAVGDLGHHTDKAVVKKVRWQTDYLGFRNDTLYPDPDVVLLGYSNVVGSSLDQDDNLAGQLVKATGLKVNNLAPYDYVGYLALMRKGFFKAPRYIIHGCIEREVPSLPAIPKVLLSNAPLSRKESLKIQWAQLKTNPIFQTMAVGMDKVIRHNTINYLRARVKGSHGRGIPSPIDPNMLFYAGKEAVIPPAEKTLSRSAKTIASYAEHASSQGIAFVFFPIPNKETIYYDKVPLAQRPDFLLKLSRILRDEKVVQVNTVPLFSRYRSSSSSNSDEILYHTDDSHWGPKGVELVVQELLPFLKD